MEILKNLPVEIWSKITKIDELKGQWVGGAKLSPQVLGRLKRSVLITSTGASTRIEGARLSDEDIEKLMRGISMQKFRDRDKQEVKGYYELLLNVFNSWETLGFSEAIIKHFHKELLKYVEKDQKPAYLTPKEIQELVEMTRNELKEKKWHPLLVIGNFLVTFLNIHPFQDGNGRISRVLTNLLLLKEGYAYMPYVSHEKLIEDNKPDYYLSLRRSQKTLKTEKPNIVPWLDFFLSVTLKQSEMAIALLSQENIDKLLSPKQIVVWQYLQTVDEATPGEIAKHTKVVRPTVSQALERLRQLKKIERIGMGRTTRYRKM